MATGITDIDAYRRERLDLVVVGHVDHGKSTVIGRLMADTGSLPEGKLEQVKATCAKNARPFEYAFLLDALKNEQAQGITIDTARCFFKTAARDYIIHDAPGHIEFIKNMVTGASRADAALLVIDAHEGVQENSKRHGYILSMLGIRQVVVLLNKMDLVGFEQAAFEAVRDEYAAFLQRLGVRPAGFIPVSAREGINMTERSSEMPWYDGPTVLEQVESFTLPSAEDDRPLRLPVQDVYKFTAAGDDRRIVAGTIESGSVAPGDEVVFLPSCKRSTVASIETFNAEAPDRARAGLATGLTLDTQVYAKPGELLVRADEAAPLVGTTFRANVFWMGRAPMVPGKRYKLKLGSARVPVELARVHQVLDASDLLSDEAKRQIDRHEVGECELECARPVAFDLADTLPETSRFVIVDGYDIAGFGVILERVEEPAALVAERVERREAAWAKGEVTPGQRLARNGHSGKFVVFVGESEAASHLAKRLERRLFAKGAQTYFLGLSEAFEDMDLSEGRGAIERADNLQRLGELARIMTDAGLLFITALDDVDGFDLETLRLLNAPSELFVVRVGDEPGELRPQAAVDVHAEENAALDAIESALGALGILGEYSI